LHWALPVGGIVLVVGVAKWLQSRARATKGAQTTSTT